jgi:hypothetical protein
MTMLESSLPSSPRVALVLLSQCQPKPPWRIHRPRKRYDAARGLLAAGLRVRTITAMTLEEIRRLLHEDAPLTIHLVSGRQFHVPHTDHAAISMNNTSLIISDDQGDIEIIRLPSIESVTLTKEPAV